MLFQRCLFSQLFSRFLVCNSIRSFGFSHSSVTRHLETFRIFLFCCSYRLWFWSNKVVLYTYVLRNFSYSLNLYFLIKSVFSSGTIYFMSFRLCQFVVTYLDRETLLLLQHYVCIYLFSPLLSVLSVVYYFFSFLRIDSDITIFC